MSLDLLDSNDLIDVIETLIKWLKAREEAATRASATNLARRNRMDATMATGQAIAYQDALEYLQNKIMVLLREVGPQVTQDPEEPLEADGSIF